jgi:phosphotriesterase-related protein
MAVQSVTGPVAAGELGTTLPHEHLFIDLRNQYSVPQDPERRRVGEEPLSAGNLHLVRRDPYVIRDNLLLDDATLAAQEAACFRRAGGRTIVDCTSRGIGRDAAGLLDIARRTGLTIVAGCGYYTQDTHPAAMPRWPAGRIADEMVRELTDGIGDTGVRAGVIGEIGTSSPIHPDEAKNLEAAAIAWRQAPVAVYVHTYPWGGRGGEAARQLIAGGVDPARIVICHGDIQLDMAYLRRLLELGVCVEFDNFGKEFQPDVAGPAEGGFVPGAFAADADRVRAILELVDAGHEGRLLITNDICLKCMLHAYGGRGYDNILTGVVPALRAAGVSQRTVDAFLIDNPRLLLAGH